MYKLCFCGNPGQGIELEILETVERQKKTPEKNPGVQLFNLLKKIMLLSILRKHNLLHHRQFLFSTNRQKFALPKSHFHLLPLYQQ